MRTPLLAGRTFREADSAPDRLLVIVDQALAAKAFLHESAVGKRILTQPRSLFWLSVCLSRRSPETVGERPG